MKKSSEGTNSTKIEKYKEVSKDQVRRDSRKEAKIIPGNRWERGRQAHDTLHIHP